LCGIGNAHQKALEFDERYQMNPRRAHGHPSTDYGVEHPIGDRYNDAGRSLHLEKLPRCSLLHATDQNPSAAIRVTAVMDFQLLSDMGRMNR
jgi:hypothetical protein